MIYGYQIIHVHKNTQNQYNKNASSHNIVLLQLTKWLKNDQATGKNNCTKCIVVSKNSLVVL
jgi:hypothetical protein